MQNIYKNTVLLYILSFQTTPTELQEHTEKRKDVVKIEAPRERQRMGAAKVVRCLVCSTMTELGSK